MALSSNTLTHFTQKKEALFGILQGHFKIFFCKETVRLTKRRQWNFYAPMVSFCDIPMSEIKDHIEKYGSYGIGLTKEWAVKNGLNPVLYVSRESALSESYHAAMKYYVEGEEEESASLGELALLDFFGYMKNYEARLDRKGTRIDKYRFSDEREWRFVPRHTDDNEVLVARTTYEKNPSKYSNLYSDFELKFEPDDIKYIIINDDSEIREVINHLRATSGGKYSFDEVDRLTSRILTTEQIKGDF
ncbi:abortive infection system antitoxin AbiGi family protein [Burkholderia lata]|uniref:Abortive phage resistance protein AbiGi, antitoxin n=1 Tax=Burkholderia lata (strain ATCC 17760 / DSM 23089 / LMG 22485 / NCIMB 9086 / R18194 / 383) TaxID=482957 RepID=A0A6P2U8Q8_BURL3|nr:abortive infection system antitoxin AbiGi family protein [Burkholderia lata]VWC64054.1 hypothetical protein BLA18109_01975 [Burkholderia lata]